MFPGRDALSRAPVKQQNDQSSTEEESDLYVRHVFASLPASNTQLGWIKENKKTTKSVKNWSNTAVKAGQTKPEYQMLLNPIGKSSMNFQFSIDGFSKLRGSSSWFP